MIQQTPALTFVGIKLGFYMQYAIVNDACSPTGNRTRIYSLGNCYSIR